jgi:hypothetical protein
MRDNQQASKLSRRSVIAALAAGAAANVPAIATVTAAGDHHPDAELIELGAEYQRLAILEQAADEHYARCSEAFDEAEPEPRDVMRHRIEDHVAGGLNLPILPGTGAITRDLKHSAFYSADEIARVRFSRPPWSDDKIPEQNARIEEIGAEWARWCKELEDLSDETGVTEALDTIDEIVATMRSLAKKIAATPATTVAGLQVRATILSQIRSEIDHDQQEVGEDHEGDDDETDDEDVCTDDLMIRAIVRDLVKMTV